MAELGYGAAMSETFRVGAPPIAPAPPDTPKRRRRLWLFAAIGVCVLATAGVAAVLYLRAGTVTIHGTLELRSADGFHLVGSQCVGDGGYSDISAGAQVVVTDETSKTVGVGSLGTGSWIGSHCEWPFEVKVPDGSAFYGVEVTHRGRVQYPADRLDKPITLTLGR